MVERVRWTQVPSGPSRLSYGRAAIALFRSTSGWNHYADPGEDPLIPPLIAPADGRGRIRTRNTSDLTFILSPTSTFQTLPQT